MSKELCEEFKPRPQYQVWYPTLLNLSFNLYKICLKSACTASTALLALIEVQGLLRQILQLDPIGICQDFTLYLKRS